MHVWLILWKLSHLFRVATDGPFRTQRIVVGGLKIAFSQWSFVILQPACMLREFNAFYMNTLEFLRRVHRYIHVMPASLVH